jgi:hypothetical protein
MKVAIVVHCWRYSRVLAYQLSSLVLFPPKDTRVTVYVVCVGDDKPTLRMLDAFDNRLNLIRIYQPIEEFRARCTGRNLAARTTNADTVWFTDADYLFREGCLDKLASLDLAEDTIHFPGKHWFQRTKQMGAENARRVKKPGIYDIDESEFDLKRFRVPYGGLQIVTGDTARYWGYCDAARSRGLEAACERVSKPITKNIMHCPCDVVFRRIIPNQPVKIKLPNLYRIRQVVGKPDEPGIHPVDTL